VSAEHVLAAAFDLKVFFTVVGKEPGDVRPVDVLAFVTAQRLGRSSIDGVVQPVDDNDESLRSSPSARTAPSSKPASSSDPPCSISTTTPPPKVSTTEQTCSNSC
jgi:hypothetical protein